MPHTDIGSMFLTVVKDGEERTLPLPHLLHLILREKLTLPQLKKTNRSAYLQTIACLPICAVITVCECIYTTQVLQTYILSRMVYNMSYII